MIYTRADRNDLEELISMRIGYIKADQGDISETTEQQMREQLPEYFIKHLEKDLFAFVAKEGENIVGTALLLMIEKPSNPHFIQGKVGEVLNVYTLPQYRRKGISTKLIQSLLEYSKEQNFDFIELSSTEDGYPLYQKLGFRETHSDYTSMRFDIK